MTSTKTASALVQKVWNYAHVLKDDGLAFMDYTEQITFLLFLKMAHERELLGLENVIPKKLNWATLKRESGDQLEVQYSKTLRELGKLPGLLGVIFAKAQNKITDPAKLERLISMMDSENWATSVAGPLANRPERDVGWEAFFMRSRRADFAADTPGSHDQTQK